MKLRKSYFFHLGLVGILIFSLASCEDDSQDDNPNKDPKVALISPAELTVYNSGEIIPLRIEISQNTPIKSYRVLIRDQATDELVYVLSEFSDEEVVNINEEIILETTLSTIMDIEVKAEDSLGNQFDEKVGSFTLNPPLGNVLGLRFNLKYEGSPLLMGETYTYPSGELFEFSRFDMFISELTLASTGDATVIKEVDFLEMTKTYRNITTANEGYIYKVAGLDDGDFESIKFNIGLTPAQNATTPSAYPASHPLGKEYWDGGWDSYIFVSIEGRINLNTDNPDFEQGIALHLGSDEALQEITLLQSFTLSDNMEEIIDIDIDLKDLFISENGDIYDIGTTPTTHNLTHIPMVVQLSNNLKNAIKD